MPAAMICGNRMVRMRVPGPILRRAVPAALAVTLTLGAAGASCGGGGAAPGASPVTPLPTGDPPPSARAELAAHAAAAQDLVGVSVYRLATPGRADRTVLVVRATDGSWRVDVPGGALGGAADVSIVATSNGQFQCALATPPARGECVPVPAGGLAAATDPRVQHVFTDWLEVLTDRSAAVAVAHAKQPPSGVAGRCFTVQPSSASLLAPLDAGTYCFEPDGTLTGAQLELGMLTLTGADRTAPPSVDLPGPVVPGGQPLPTASPTPPPAPPPGLNPTPSPDPSPRTSPAGPDGPG